METKKENAKNKVEIIFWKWKVKQTKKQTKLGPIRDKYHSTNKWLELPKIKIVILGDAYKHQANNTKLAEVPKVYVTEMIQQSLGPTIVSLRALDRTMEEATDQWIKITLSLQIATL